MGNIQIEKDEDKRKIYIGNDICRKTLLLPEGIYSKKTFCQLMNRLLKHTSMIYRYVEEKYPSSGKCEIDNLLEKHEIDQNLLKDIEQEDELGVYEHEALDKKIMTDFVENMELLSSLSQKEDVLANRAVQCILLEEENNIIKEGLPLVTKDKEAYHVFEHCRKSRIRFKNDEKVDKIKLLFYSKHLDYCDYITMHESLWKQISDKALPSFQDRVWISESLYTNICPSCRHKTSAVQN
jgi:hypothetical protein